MSKVLVFGGAGFLGSYLCEELARRNYQVTIADLREPAPELACESFIPCDIRSESDIDNAFKVRPEFVYNLAAFANLDEAVKHPIETMELNVMGNLRVLDASYAYKTERYLYASSAYAMSSKGSFYGISKLASEKNIEEYNKRLGLDYTILRYGSVYAECDYDNNYIYQLVKEAMRYGKIIHRGDGEEMREYIHAADAAKLSVDVLANGDYVNRHVVLTGQERMKRRELFQMVQEMLGGDLEIELQTDAEVSHYRYTPYTFRPSLSVKLVANPHIDMGQGLLRCIQSVYDSEEG